jgi:hypothetical protein
LSLRSWRRRHSRWGQTSKGRNGSAVLYRRSQGSDSGMVVQWLLD